MIQSEKLKQSHITYKINYQKLVRLQRLDGIYQRGVCNGVWVNNMNEKKNNFMACNTRCAHKKQFFIGVS